MRYAIALLFVLAGFWAMLVRGNAWPFAMEDLRLAPHESLIAESQMEVALEQEVLNGEVIAGLARTILSHEPLAVYPFEGLLSAEVDRERLVPGSMDVAAADTYAEATLDRDGRNLTARFYLLDKAIIAGDWDDALEQFGGAFELWPEERDELLFGLEQMLVEPGMVDALIRASDRRVDWIPGFLRQIPIETLEPDQIERLYRPQPEAHEQLLVQLTRAGELEQAYLFWRSLQPEEAAKFKRGVTDPSFEGSPLLPPFNWQLDSEFAEFMPTQAALQIFYRGRGRAVFASQIMRLTPGHYLFRMTLDSVPDDTGGDFVWQIVCMTSDEFPLEISIFDYAAIEEDDAVAFEISDACAYQELSMRGYPGQFTRNATLQINDIEIIAMEETR
ncbi:MAG: hypothetical protein AAGJ68_12000 [Pseudomonadota bacterium]